MVRRIDLVRTLGAEDNGNKERRILLRADKFVPYGEMMDVLERLRTGGYLTARRLVIRLANLRAD